MNDMFTTPCFIRKNTPELRKKLEELGYKLNNGKWMGKFLATFRIKDTKIWRYVASPVWDLQNNPDINESIDCGDNEELFLAIAALRDDSDYMQYFVTEKERHWINQVTWMPKGSFMKSFVENFPKDDVHKATVEELIEHFKH